MIAEDKRLLEQVIGCIETWDKGGSIRAHDVIVPSPALGWCLDTLRGISRRLTSED